MDIRCIKKFNQHFGNCDIAKHTLSPFHCEKHVCVCTNAVFALLWIPLAKEV